MKENIANRNNQMQQIENILKQITESGITEENILSQLMTYKRGAPPIKLNRPCTKNDGIIISDESKYDSFIQLHDEAARQGRISKFVPASGAASRMFKHLNALLNLPEPLTSSTLDNMVAKGDEAALLGQIFFSGINSFAFYEQLKSSMDNNGLDLETLLISGELQPILKYLLTPAGLNYANMPKALISFFTESNRPLTPLESHMIEGIAYTKNSENTILIHFSVPESHYQTIEKHLETAKTQFNHENVVFDITLSVQKQSTDTITVDLSNEPLRTEDNQLIFRPSGHGALLSNLNDLDGDIVFIKTIDNAVQRQNAQEVTKYKKILGGYLIALQQNIFENLRYLDNNNINNNTLNEILAFCQQQLNIQSPTDWLFLSIADKTVFLKTQLNRPLRICGMVINEGEPGGGPFWVDHDDGQQSLQIVEVSQIDTSLPDQQMILSSATHFNPVDIVCGLRDYHGNAFNLDDYVDPQTGFITIKSKDGIELKALELPGLWNGSMANWITIFMEVPSFTFNPVKTVNDLLRSENQQIEPAIV